MKRFLVINTINDDFNDTFSVFLSENGYKKIVNPYLEDLEDEDHHSLTYVLLVDTFGECYCYANFYSKLINSDFLSFYELEHRFRSKDEVVSLERIIELAEKI